ncbi:MAG: hypothetical protein EHM70_10275 [Chloroflexota bacterium]|nr:MAG: hypothetical protein EHM70_10275 [Chloroflexota bacterium]
MGKPVGPGVGVGDGISVAVGGTRVGVAVSVDVADGSGVEVGSSVGSVVLVETGTVGLWHALKSSAAASIVRQQ